MGFIYFSYGMTKSASSFVYQLEEQIFKLSKYNLMKIPPEIRGNRAPENYVEPITDEKVQEILGWLPEDAVTVIKTHGAPSKLACDLVNQGKAFASATFRDPRDIAVSLADHGARSREKGIADFANFVRPIDALPEIKNQLNRLNPWLNLSRCRAFSYDLIRSTPEAVVKKILDQVELEKISINDILEPFQDRTKIIHYNVGSVGRYKEHMTEKEELQFKSEFEELLNMCGRGGAKA
ncbi:hypothetical protein KGQ90_13515 [Modicisalibacter tunisiensis]|uniref:hypothetical protein n=1 Tax=Modicisalibacter tunisiensis TaxID=390637 RepID=UPI001CCB0749|nr:hypothetical protein [Modicisalibacter tunisiensis]MBZ9539948.1 hypothetical protein [Modicisalibacter tunisiensis]